MMNIFLNPNRDIGLSIDCDSATLIRRGDVTVYVSTTPNRSGSFDAIAIHPSGRAFGRVFSEASNKIHFSFCSKSTWLHAVADRRFFTSEDFDDESTRRPTDACDIILTTDELTDWKSRFPETPSVETKTTPEVAAVAPAPAEFGETTYAIGGISSGDGLIESAVIPQQSGRRCPCCKRYEFGGANFTTLPPKCDDCV